MPDDSDAMDHPQGHLQDQLGGDLDGHLESHLDGRFVDVGESRQHFRPRQRLRWPAVLSVAGDPTAPTTLAMTHGVSVGGAFVETDLPLAVGQMLHLWLHPPGPMPPGHPHVLRLRAEVRWARPVGGPNCPKGLGVQFQALTGAEELALHAHFSMSDKVV